MTPNSPWTHEELQALLPKLEKKLVTEEIENPGIRGLPPMTVEESKNYFFKLIDIAKERPITFSESLIFGQLLSVFQQAVRAEMLGKKGRFFVISEDEINQIEEKL